MLILDLIIEIQTCNERCYVRADTKEGAEEWIRTLRKAAVSLIDMQLCTGQVLNKCNHLQVVEVLGNKEFRFINASTP